MSSNSSVNQKTKLTEFKEIVFEKAVHYKDKLYEIIGISRYNKENNQANIKDSLFLHGEN